eukprot:465296-Lingulodinium_polyedra.AAC.1
MGWGRSASSTLTAPVWIRWTRSWRALRGRSWCPPRPGGPGLARCRASKRHSVASSSRHSPPSPRSRAPC